MSHLLTKEGGPVTVTSRFVAVTLTWETSTGGQGGMSGAFKKFKGVNLDNVGILVQGTRPVNYAGLDNLTPEDGVSHSGDDKKGKRPETLTVEPAKVPGHITEVLLSVAAFQPGQSFRNAKNVRVTIKADEDYVIQPSLVGHANFIGAAKLVRAGAGWQLVVVDEHRQIAQGDRDSLVLAAQGM
jgi:tellurium resistance protein TerZ